MNDTPSNNPLAILQSLPKAFQPTGLPGAGLGAAADPSGAATALKDYLVDAAERTVLFLDILRQRGNEQADMTSRPLATVLTFGHEILVSGKGLKRPINYSLSRVNPPETAIIDPKKRPVVIVDPRAGQGPGIGGFHYESEIGDAFAAGHTVYFIGFAADPVPGQTFLDVVEGQVSFFERVVEMHPDAPRPFAVGNCQAGYQTLMVAMLRPDLFGPILMPGSPISYWQGVHGKNPMRYAGGLAGGSWLTALTSDLGAGKFDGAYLIENFDNLNPGNTVFSKQYDVYKAVDTEGPRFLGFEKWWGDFITLNGEEIQYLVDKHFIGDKLVRNEIATSDGRLFDIRNVTSPIICFTSLGDNISPPQQTLGWIIDLYEDVDDIRAQGKTIVYCVDPKVGHLAIFVSPKVAEREHEVLMQTMDIIDVLPPGLYELVVTPKVAGEPGADLVTGGFLCKFEARTLDDIRAFGRNSEADERAFAAVARVSEIGLANYRTYVQPFVKAFANEQIAEAIRAMNPVRTQYTAFAELEPADEARRRGGGEGPRQPAPGRGRQPVPEASGAGGGRDRRRLERLPRLARQDRGAALLRDVQFAGRAGGGRRRRRRVRAAQSPGQDARAARRPRGDARRVPRRRRQGRPERSEDPRAPLRLRRRPVDRRALGLRAAQGRAASGRALARRHEADHPRAGLRAPPGPRPGGSGARRAGAHGGGSQRAHDGRGGDCRRGRQADAGDGAETEGRRGPARRRARRAARGPGPAAGAEGGAGAQAQPGGRVTRPSGSERPT